MGSCAGKHARCVNESVLQQHADKRRKVQAHAAALPSPSSPAVRAVPAVKAAPAKEEDTGPWLVVGLGNPGETYKLHRHNIGMRVVDELARLQGTEY